MGVAHEDGRAEVKLARYRTSHPFGRLNATDNVFAFTTQRYASQPLVVQSPGAGPGVFADLLRLTSGL